RDDCRERIAKCGYCISLDKGKRKYVERRAVYPHHMGSCICYVFRIILRSVCQVPQPMRRQVNDIGDFRNPFFYMFAYNGREPCVVVALEAIKVVVVFVELIVRRLVPDIQQDEDKARYPEA